MSANRPVRARATASVATALLSAAAMVAVLAPEACAAPSSAPSALPLPLPAAGAESLVTEGLTIEGPLVNNVSLPTLT